MAKDNYFLAYKPIDAAQSINSADLSFIMPTYDLGDDVMYTISVQDLALSPAFSFRGYREVNAAGSVTSTDDVVNCTENTFTLTLPTASGIQGRVYDIKNSGNGVVTLATTGSETIDGVATQDISTQDNLTPMSDGTNWILIG